MDKTTVIIGSDHAGFDLKERVKQFLLDKGYDVQDEGTYSSESTDYPDYAHKVSEEVEGDKGLGVLICGSANGVSMAANKHAGVRSAIAWTPELARLARTHNDANILSLPARFISETEAMEIMEAFLQAEFEGGRHKRRVDKIDMR
ncbi:MAG: ribose 5-phosphate isomerase B [Flavobacteriales bacterium]|nr:ribose 5-phosphate isomerase B [Flavobacteriales bacterium]